MVVRLVVSLALGFCIWLPVLCLAQSQPTNTFQAPNTIVIKDHQFIPPQLTIPC